MFFHNDSAPSSPYAIHALLRELAFIDEPQEFGINQVVEESRAGEMQQVPVHLPSSLPPSSTLETSTTTAYLLNGEHMITTPAMVQAAIKARHPHWFRPCERKHHRRPTPPDPMNSFEHCENDDHDDHDVMTFAGVGLFEVPPVIDDRNTGGAGMAASSKKKRGHRRNNSILKGDFI